MTMNPRQVLFSPKSRWPRKVLPPSIGVAHRLKHFDLSQITCATPAKVKVASRKKVQFQEFTVLYQMSKPVSFRFW